MQEGKWVLDKTELEVRATSKLGTQKITLYANLQNI